MYNVESFQIDVNEPAVRSSFSGFDVAIDGNQASKRAVVVRHSDFEKNRVGIRFTNMPYFQIYDNEISLGGLIEVDPELEQNPNLQTPNTQDMVLVGYENGLEEYAPIWYEGVFVSGGFGFLLAENSIDGVTEAEGGVNDDFTRIGIRVRDTKTKDDEIRLNYLSDLTIANKADGDNADSENNGGLRYICNVNERNHFDIQVDDYAGMMDVAIASIQHDYEPNSIPGLPDVEHSADNSFTQETSILEPTGRIWNDGVDIAYFYDDQMGTAPETNPGLEFYNVDVSNPQDVLPNFCETEWDNNSQHNPALVNGHLEKAIDVQEGLWEAQILYLSLLDAGSTEELQNEILSA